MLVKRFVTNLCPRPPHKVGSLPEDQWEMDPSEGVQLGYCPGLVCGQDYDIYRANREKRNIGGRV